MPSLAQLSAIRGLWATVVGVGLIVIALLVGDAWFIPLLVVGVVLIFAGVFGPRIRGRFSLEFGEGGMALDVQLHLAPPGQVGRLPRRATAAAAAVVPPAEVAPVPESVVAPAMEPEAASAPVVAEPEPQRVPPPSPLDAAELVRKAVVSANGNGNGHHASSPADTTHY
jgi:hypothetical protein